MLELVKENWGELVAIGSVLAALLIFVKNC